MDFAIRSDNPEKYRGDCIVVGVFESRKLTEAARVLDEAGKGHLGRIVDQGIWMAGQTRHCYCTVFPASTVSVYY